MLGKVILWITAILFTPYGIACLLSPELPAGYAGLEIISGDGYAEIGAMYGGLQIGFGLFCALGALRDEHYRTALLAVVCCVGLLGLSRLFSAMTGTEPVGTYTHGALVYEIATAVIAAAALRRN